jgi:hypothetical protein
VISAASLSLICAATERDRACAIACRPQKKTRLIAKSSVRGRGDFTKAANQTRKVDGKNIRKQFGERFLLCRARVAFYRRTYLAQYQSGPLVPEAHPLHFPP